jgi:hypothetical protein
LTGKILLISWAENNFCFPFAKPCTAFWKVVLVTELFHLRDVVPSDMISDPGFDDFKHFVAAEVVGCFGQL